MTTTARLIAALTAALLALTLAPGATTAHAVAPSLTITPGDGHFTGGSQLRLTGHLGVSGRRALIVQRNMDRPGDVWTEAPGTRAHTNADGSFDITAPAPAMWAIRYRVISGKYATPAVLTHSRAQEVIVTQTSRGVVGQALTFHADTVARAYKGYRDLPSPLLAGRTLALQRRASPTQWDTVATTTSDARGQASFSVTHRRAGDVYRVRMADWRRNGDDIGWTASFPHRVTARAGRIKAGTLVNARTLAAATSAPAITAPLTSAGPSDGGGRQHAFSRYGWGRDPRYRYEWEAGQSLTTGPLLGSQMKGRWIDGGDGTGRVTMRNGAMLFSSDGYGSAPDGASGSTWATLSGAQARLGRWEIRGVTTQGKGGGRKYRVRYELVPVRQSAQRCGTASIVLAESRGPGTPLTFGVRGANGTTWGRTIKQSSVAAASSIAVQVTAKHITWFVNGQPTGTVRAKAAIPQGPMTVRVSLVGDGTSTMDSAKSSTDWVRSFTLKHGKRPTSRTRLRTGAPHGGC